MLSWKIDTATQHTALHVLIATGIGTLSGMIAVIGTAFMDMPLLAVMLPLSVAFVIVTLHYPEYSILIAIALTNGLIAPDVLPVFSFGPLGVSIPELIVVLLLFLTFLRITSHPGYKVFGSPLMLPLLMFLSIVLLSSVYAYVVRGVSLGIIIPQLRNYLFWALFFAVIHLIRDPVQIKRFMVGLWLLTVMLSIGALLPQVFNNTPFLNSSTLTLVTADRAFEGVTRLYFGGERLLYVMIPVTVAWIALVQKQRSMPYLIILVMLVGWLFFSFQRNYWVTSALSLGLLSLLIMGMPLLRMLKRMLPLLFVALVALVLLQLTQPQVIERQVTAASHRLLSLVDDPTRSDSSTQWRLIENRHALDSLSESPFIGIGIGNRYRPRMVDELETPLDWYIHNTYLWIAVKTGIINLVLFLTFCLLYLWRVLRYWSQIKRDDFRAIYLGFGAAFFGMMISNIVAPNFIQSPALSIYPVMIGISEVIWHLGVTRHRNAVRSI